jgi:aminoglycoside phosphotransferase (APT) family kinase protein
MHGSGRTQPPDSDMSLETVRHLIAENFPEFGSMPITRLAVQGSHNHMYRLGRELCIRLPRNRHIAFRLERETQWLPQISGNLPLLVPVPVASAGPSAEFPMPWAIYRWIEGEPLLTAGDADEAETARLLASFIKALRNLDPTGAPPSYQDRSLQDRNLALRAALPHVSHVFDETEVIAIWEQLLYAQPPASSPTWTHGDLLPPNLLMQHGRLAAVIDFGCLGTGDPGLDLLPAWSAFGEIGRAVFRNALEIDDTLWRRGRAIALYQAVVISANQIALNGPTLSTAIRMGRSALSIE